MTVTLVHVWVKDAFVEDFISATLENQRYTLKESGNLRFDILRESDNPAKFVLYESFRSPEDEAAHKTTAHYLKWREAVADWMAQPRSGIKHRIVTPLV